MAKAQWQAYNTIRDVLFQTFITEDGELTKAARDLNCEITQDWDTGSTFLTFPDGSELRFSEGFFRVSGYEATTGRIGGSAKTEAKAKASANNGKLGGRPPKPWEYVVINDENYPVNTITECDEAEKLMLEYDLLELPVFEIPRKPKSASDEIFQNSRKTSRKLFLKDR